MKPSTAQQPGGAVAPFLAWAGFTGLADPGAAPPLHAAFRGRPRRVALVDPCGGGHHFQWMVDFCLAFVQAGSSVTAMLPDPERLEAALAAARPGAAANVSAVSSSGILEQASHRQHLRKAVSAARSWARLRDALDALPAELRPDAVFFPYVDAFLARGLPPWVVDSLFPYSWSALYMAPSWMRTGRSFWPALSTSEAWCLKAAHCESVALIDEGLVRAFGEFLPGKPVIQLPDFLPSTSAALAPGQCEELLERARGRRIVGVVGSLQSRKGISTLLKLAQSHPDDPFFYVFAGQLSLANFPPDEVQLWQSAVQRPPENCYIRPHAVPDEAEYTALANTCDIFYAAYLAFGNSSNALAWAAWLKKPVVVSAGYLMEERVRRYHMGEVVPEGDARASREALLRIHDQLHAPDARAHYGFNDYLRDHSTDRLEQGVRQIRSSLAP